MSRVNETERILAEMGANVTKMIFPGRQHTILREEIELARQILTGKKAG